MIEVRDDKSRLQLYSAMQEIYNSFQKYTDSYKDIDDYIGDNQLSALRILTRASLSLGPNTVSVDLINMNTLTINIDF